MATQTKNEPITRIVVAVDGSAHANNAVLLASDLAQKYDAELHLIHVVSSKPLGSEELHLAEVEFADRLSAVGLEEPDGVVESYGRAGFGPFLRTQESRNKVVRQILGEQVIKAAENQAHSSGAPNVSSTIAEGDPAEQIIDTAVKSKANLIVIGSRGLSGLQEMWLGSVSQKVAHLSPVNVITVR